MSSPTTISLLNDTLSPHPATVLNAENQLNDRNFRPGFLSDLFRLAIATPVTPRDSAVSLAAAIYLKNLIRRAWQNVHVTSFSATSLLPHSDRDFVRAQIVPALVNAPPRICAQLTEALKRIISADFPLRFPFLVDHIITRLASNDPAAVHASLVALRALAKVYEFKATVQPLPSSSHHPQQHNHNHNHTLNINPQNQSSQPNPFSLAQHPDLLYLHDHPTAAVNHLVQLIFPTLLRIMYALESAIDSATDSQQRHLQFDMQRIICKIFWSFNHHDIPAYLVSNLSGPFSDWMSVFLCALCRPIIPVYTAEDHPSEEDLRCMPQWKVKQWACHIVYRLFQRYSNPSRLNPNLLRNYNVDVLTTFGDFFRRNFAAQFTRVMLEILSTDHRLLSPRVANLALLYLETAVSIGLTYKVIKPSLHPLITSVIFPYLCITEADLALWEEDPVEYVRKSHNVLEDFNTPRAAACSLLYVMVKLRRSTVLPQLMTFLIHVLDQYSAVRDLPVDQSSQTVHPDCSRHDLARRKDGALLAIGTIRDTLAAHQQAPHHLQMLLQQHVLPEFQSDIPFLRSRACWLYGQFAAAESLPSDALTHGLLAVQQRLTDPQFPVRVRAAVDIRHFIQNSEATHQIAPYLPDLFNLLFSMLDDVDSTDIVATIDQLAVGFSDRIVPLAPDLCSKLVQTFTRAVSTAHGDEEAGFAAVQCLQALSSIVTSVSVAVAPTDEKVDLFNVLERQAALIFDNMLQEDRIEFFEESLELLSTLVFHSAEETGMQLQSACQSPVAVDTALLSQPIVRAAGDMYTSGKMLTAIKADVEHGGGAISPYLWSLLTRLMRLFRTWASDYSFHYIQVLDAYLSKGMHVFVLQEDGNSTYVEMFLGMVSRLWEDSSSSEEEMAIQGSQFCGLYLQHCRRIDRPPQKHEIIALSQMLVRRMRNGRSSDDVNVSLIRSLAHLLYLMPGAVLSVIDSRLSCTTEVFDLWMGMVQQGNISKPYDRKVNIIALCAIVGSDWMTLPTAVRQSIPQLVLAIVSLLETLAGNSDSRRLEGIRDTRHVLAGQNLNECNNGAAERFVASTDKVQYEDVDDNADIDANIGAVSSEWDELEQELDGPEEVEDSGIMMVLEDVDEWLLFESVARRVPNMAWQQLGMVLAKADTLRVESALHRAAEMRSVGDVHVS